LSSLRLGFGLALAWLWLGFGLALAYGGLIADQKLKRGRENLKISASKLFF
jgi:hypothetical protein